MIRILIKNSDFLILFRDVDFWGGKVIIDYVKYDVLVSEEVDFVEFYDKYEILDTKGEIYTVKLKEIETIDERR